METKFTPGPWFADSNGAIWRRPPENLYQNGGGVAGDRPLAAANKGWFGENETGYPVEANGRLIAAAPELFEALQGALKALDAIGNEMTVGDRFSNAGQYLLDALMPARDAINKATREQS